jgi:hypothetical protein
MLLGLGMYLLFISVSDLQEAARLAPVVRPCNDWLQAPEGPRWVTLTGCKLNLEQAASRKWKGWRSVRDGGVSGEKLLELYVPFLSEGQSATTPVHALLATTDVRLIQFLTDLEPLSPAEIEKTMDLRSAELELLLNPPELTGYVEPVPSMGARSAMRVLTAEDAVVLEQGRDPPRANAVFGLVVGLVCVALGLRPMFRRMMVERDISQ